MAKPIQMVVAVRAMWAILVINAILIFGSAALPALAPTGKGALSIFQLLVAALVIVLVGSVIRSVSSARKWARVIYAVIVGLAIFGALGRLVASPLGSATMILECIVIAAYAGVLFLLFHPVSNAWFKHDGHAAP